MIISAPIFEAYLKCPSKCWLLYLDEKGAWNVYSDFIQMRDNAYLASGIERLMVKFQECEYGVVPRSVPVNIKTASWRLAIDVIAKKDHLESHLNAVERLSSKGQDKPVQFIPIRFIVANKLTKSDKLLLTFDSLVLQEMIRQEIPHGKIIHGNGYTAFKVKTPVLTGEVRKITGKIIKMLMDESPPDLVLNRHCSECKYEGRCRQRAIEKDDLSLLAGMAEKERKKLNSKGIFTVTQFPILSVPAVDQSGSETNVRNITTP